MDKVTFRILLSILGAALIVLLIGAIFLMSQDKTVPDWYTTIAASIVTGVLGLAVKSPEGVQQVVNPPDNPMQVVQAPAPEGI